MSGETADDREAELERRLEEARARVVEANKRPLVVSAAELTRLRGAAYQAWQELEEYRRSRRMSKEPPPTWRVHVDTPLLSDFLAEQGPPAAADGDSSPTSSPTEPSEATNHLISDRSFENWERFLLAAERKRGAPKTDEVPFFSRLVSRDVSLIRGDLIKWLYSQALQSASVRQPQRPAAYRFELRDEKIGVLPEPPEPRDREFALDTYDELVAKARELFARLSGTNSAQRLCNRFKFPAQVIGTGDFSDDT